MKTTAIQIKIEPEIKEKASKLIKERTGLSMSSWIRQKLVEEINKK